MPEPIPEDYHDYLASLVIAGEIQIGSIGDVLFVPDAQVLHVNHTRAAVITGERTAGLGVIISLGSSGCPHGDHVDVGITVRLCPDCLDVGEGPVEHTMEHPSRWLRLRIDSEIAVAANTPRALGQIATAAEKRGLTKPASTAADVQIGGDPS